MKRKLFTLLLLVAVGLSLFVSCSAAPEAVEADSDALAYVRFGEEAATRSFTATYDIQDYDNLYWFYTATKTDGYGKTGDTTATGETPVATTGEGESKVPVTGLEGTIGPFSQGDWTFTLKAYAAVDSTTKKGQNLVYENETAVSVTLRGGETKSIPVTVKAVGEKGLLSFRDLSGSTEANKAFFKWADGADTSSKPYFTIEATKTTDNTLYTLTTDQSVTGNNVINIVLGAYDSTAKGYPIQYFKTENGSSVSADISLPVGYYSCRIYAYRAGETAEKNLIAIDKSLAFRIYGGATTVVSGDLTENPNSTVTFDVPKVAIVQVIPSATEATTVSASVAPKESTEASVTAKTDVTIPQGVLDSTGSTSYSLEVSSLSENSASNSFTVSAADSTGGTAKIYGSVSLSLNAVKDNTSTAVTTFTSPVTVSVFVGKGLSDVTIKYVNDDGTEAETSLQPTVEGDGLGYNSTTGMFTFTTTHFSTFVVASTKSAVVKNVSNGKLYNSLAEAINELGDTSELKLIAALTDNSEIALGEESTSSLVIDLDNKEVKSVSLDAKSGSITLKNGTVTGATVKSGDVTLKNTTSKNVAVDKAFAGRLTFDGGKLEAGDKYAFIQSSDAKESIDYQRASYVFQNLEVSAGSECGIKVFRAKEVIIRDCTFKCSDSEGTKFISAIDIPVMNTDSEIDGTDITITGCTFKGVENATDEATGTAGAIKIKSSYNNLKDGNPVGLGKVTIQNNTFTDCVRDVTVGKRDAYEGGAYKNYSIRTKSAVDAKGNVLTENGWTISGNSSNRTENLIGIAVYSDESNTKKSAEIGQVVGGCTVYDISTAYEARIGERNYLTLQGAIDAAASGDTIYILKDIDLNLTSDAAGVTIGGTDGSPKENYTITIDGNSHTLYNNNSCGENYRLMNIQYLTNSTVNLKNMSLISSTSSSYLRGINFIDVVSSKVELDNVDVLIPDYYAVNITRTSFDNSEITVKNSTISGWATVNTFGANLKIALENCILKSSNKHNGPSDDFASIVVNTEAIRSSVSISGCEFEVTKNAFQYVASLRSTDGEFTLKNCNITTDCSEFWQVYDPSDNSITLENVIINGVSVEDASN